MEVKKLTSLTRSLVKPEDAPVKGAQPVADQLKQLTATSLSNTPSVAECKNYLAEVSTILDKCFDDSLSIKDILTGRATAIDELLTRLWHATLKDEADTAALIAVRRGFISATSMQFSCCFISQLLDHI